MGGSLTTRQKISCILQGKAMQNTKKNEKSQHNNRIQESTPLFIQRSVFIFGNLSGAFLFSFVFVCFCGFDLWFHMESLLW